MFRRLRLMTDDRQERVLVQVVALQGQDDVLTIGRLLQSLLQVDQQVGEHLPVRLGYGDVGIELT